MHTQDCILYTLECVPMVERGLGVEEGTKEKNNIKKETDSIHFEFILSWVSSCLLDAHNLFYSKQCLVHIITQRFNNKKSVKCQRCSIHVSFHFHLSLSFLTTSPLLFSFYIISTLLPRFSLSLTLKSTYFHLHFHTLVTNLFWLIDTMTIPSRQLR